MKKILFVIFLIISCPRPSIQKFFETDYLKEAERSYKENPIYAYDILENYVTSPENVIAQTNVLVKIYLDQREYESAAQLLDSINWKVNLNQDVANIILLKTKRWRNLAETAEDNLLKGIAYYNLKEYDNAIGFLSMPNQPHDYRMLYLAKAYSQSNKFEDALKTFIDIDSLSPYLFKEYQDLLFELLLNIEDLDILQKEVSKLKELSLKNYILLTLYEKKKDKKKLEETAWVLIKKYPESAGAYYALSKVKPTTKLEHKLFGKVNYYHGNYDDAIKYLNKSYSNDEVNYYLGRIYYSRGKYSEALKHFGLSDWGAAYYYRGRIYENLNNFSRAIAMYDSLYYLNKGSNYAIRGYKRKAFLLEDIGDTLKAVETFLTVGEKNTEFRAAMQLYKVGKLNEAIEILDNYTSPEFIYWQSRVREKLGEPAESLNYFLSEKHPLSYYSLVRQNNGIPLDTTSLDNWIRQFGDSTITFDNIDSLHLENAMRYLRLNEVDYAIEELGMIEDKSPQDLLFLSRFCGEYGADQQSIIYGLKIKNIAEARNIRKMPLEFLKLLYPVRYTFTILDNEFEMTLCLAMIWQESLFNPEALSPANAIGLMQIIPETAKNIANDLQVPSYSLENPSTSIQFGSYYFSRLLGDFNSVPLSLAGYNAGPVRVRRWVAKNPNYEIDEFIEFIPYNETRDYIKSVLARQVIYKNLLNKY
jgi:soluble lytic murein transglycosylase-like protein